MQCTFTTTYFTQRLCVMANAWRCVRTSNEQWASMYTRKNSRKTDATNAKGIVYLNAESGDGRVVARSQCTVRLHTHLTSNMNSVMVCRGILLLRLAWIKHENEKERMSLDGFSASICRCTVAAAAVIRPSVCFTSPKSSHCHCQSANRTHFYLDSNLFTSKLIKYN